MLSIKRSWIKRGKSPLKRRTALRRGKPLRRCGRKAKTSIKKSGRVMLGRIEYKALCESIWARDDGQCQIQHEHCWQHIPLLFAVRCGDHIVKRSRGGSDIMENLHMACPPCHDWADNQDGKTPELVAQWLRGACERTERYLTR
jgi:5-methylcytosine-specific restriction endonuclease McrA